MKNIKYKYIILALSVFFLVTSCDRELDINPEQSVGTNVVISTPESVEQILIGAYKIREMGIFLVVIYRYMQIF